MTIAPATFHLPPASRIEDCHQLFDFLSSAQDQDVQIDCQNVSRLSGLCAQLLTMGAKAWAAKGRQFQFWPVSDNFRNDVVTLGMADVLTIDGAKG